MNPEELIEKYKHLIPITLQKMFHNAEKMAISKGLEYDDLYQYGLMGLFEASKTYEQKQHTNLSLRNYCIRNIKWSVGKGLERDSLNKSHYKNKYSKHKKENHSVTLLSMNQPYKDSDEISFYDIVGCDGINNFESNNVETHAFISDKFKNLLDKLKEKDRAILRMRVEEDLTCEEIAQRYGVSRQAINVKLNRIIKKLTPFKGELI